MNVSCIKNCKNNCWNTTYNTMYTHIHAKFGIIFIVRRAGLLWSQQDFEWRWSVPLFKCLTVLEFSFILFDLCLLITFFNFIMNYVPIVTFWIFTYHKIWILSIMFCFIWSYWIIYFLACLSTLGNNFVYTKWKSYGCLRCSVFARWDISEHWRLFETVFEKPADWSRWRYTVG